MDPEPLNPSYSETPMLEPEAEAEPEEEEEDEDPISQPSSDNNLSDPLLLVQEEEEEEPNSNNPPPDDVDGEPEENENEHATAATSPRKKRRRRRKQFPEMIPSAAAVHGLRLLRQTKSSSSSSSIYSYYDDFIDDTPAKQRRRDLARDADMEASLIALSVGFPVDSLTEEEIEHNVVASLGGVEQKNYIVVRNHILARWRSNVTTWLTLDHAFDSIKSESLRGMVPAAYSFLFEHGYINFGLTPVIKEVKAEGGMGSVVIVGAGLAGLAAAQHLITLGFKVVILEGRQRPGGRVRTRKMTGGGDKDGVVAAVDLGGSVLTGINGNPLGVLARQLGFPLHKVRDICPLYLPNGKAVDSEMDSRVEVDFNRLLDKVCKLREEMLEEVKSADVSLGSALEAFRNVYKVAEEPQERMLLDWHLANLEYANASLLSDLSMAFWDQDDPYEMGGDHCFIPGGNARFVRVLAENLPIMYNRTVEKIHYGLDGVMVFAGGQVYRGDMALCTVPLGVLKKESIQFVPQLPQPKREAIQRLGFGLLNKVAMLFPYDFWGGEIDTFGHLTDDSSMRGEFFLFYSYCSVSGGPLLVALVAGESAVKFEEMSPVDTISRVLDILRRIFIPKGILVPDPIQVICTRWGKDPFTYGSYSYVAIGSSGDDYDILAESVGDGRVFFAGEATNRRYPATMHGALLSGLREAAKMLRVAKKRSLVLAEERNHVRESNGAKEMNVVRDEKDDLDKLFETSDFSCGSFSVLFDPRSSDPDTESLIRVEFGGQKLASSPLYLYGLIRRKQAMELHEVEGDGSRMKVLNNDYGVRLVGRKKLGSVAESLIACIKAMRGMCMNPKASKGSFVLYLSYKIKYQPKRTINGIAPVSVGLSA